MKESLTIKLLADCKHYIPELGQLWNDEVGNNSDSCPDIRDTKQRFLEHCNKDKLPIAYVAIYHEKPIGMVCLRITEGLQDDLTPWLGGLVVHPEYRGKKIGQKLISIVKEQAIIFGYAALFLLTYDALSSWYAELGWKKIGSPNNDPDVIIMKFGLN